MSDPATWRRLGAGTVAVFLVTGAFLAGRVRAGDDPALGHAKAAQTQTVPRQQTQAQSTYTDQNPPTTSAS